MSVVYLLLAFLAGAILCYIFLSERLRSQSSQLTQIDPLRQENAALLSSLGHLKGRLETVESARAEMAQTFRAASAEALRESSTQFLQLAQERFERLKGEAGSDLGRRQQAIEQLIKPLRETLDRVDQQVRQVEIDRVGSYSVLTMQVEVLAAEARKLSTALASPTARGRWGEVQLRRVVELAGMIDYCDFAEQSSIPGMDSALRPDLIIQLPNEKQIVVDSKVPLTAYLAACELNDEGARKLKLEEHARQIRGHLKRLGSKNYSAQLRCSPEFVVAFLPGEIFFSAALQVDSELLEYGVQNNVILATPTTLIALLKAVAYGWKQDQVARSAQEIRKLGAQLYERISVFAGHYEAVGKGLRNAVAAYDKGRNSMESRLLATARKFEEFGVASGGAAALPEPLPFSESLSLETLDFGVDDESRSDAGGSGEAPTARSA